MNNSVVNHPLYLKLAQVIMGLVGFFFILYIGKTVIVPLVFSAIIAILLNPVVNYLHHKGINRIIAIFLALIAALSLLAGLFYFLVSQAGMFTDSLPQFKASFKKVSADAVDWVSTTFSISKPNIQAWFKSLKSGGMSNGSAVLSSTVSGLGNLFAFIVLLPVYIFMILFYKPLLLEFIAKLFKKEKHTMVAEVLLESKTIIQSYLSGLLLEAAILAVLNSAGLLMLGVHYAVLLGVLGAILNIIPYIGGIIAITLPAIMALATQSFSTAVWVVVVYMVIQFFDNNVLVPKIVASKVKINALISLVGVLAGGALWGVAGMFLSIPVIAIAKVIFDRIEGLEPFGFLLGDNQPDIGKSIFNFNKIVNRKSVLKKQQTENKA